MLTRYGPSSAVFLASSVINTNSTGDVTLISGVASKTIRVHKLFFVVDGTTNITFKNGSTAVTGAMSLTANGSFVLDFDGEPWFLTSPGNAFALNQSGTAQISGRIYYTQS